MTAAEPALQPPPVAAIVRPRRESTSSWPLVDRLAYWLCWAVGIGLCVVAVGIVLFMFIKGISALRPNLFVESPSQGVLQEKHSGGFLDPLIGTFIVTAIGIAIALPVGVGIAVWLVEYGRPRWLMRTVESAIEMIAGIPSIVLALFGLLLFARSFFGLLSGSTSAGEVLGQSFFNAGIVMSVLALPLIVVATREALLQLPARTREASFALGKTRATTVRRVLLPSIRPGVASGAVLGMGRIIGDTAIILILLGTLKLEGAGGAPLLSTLRGTGSTLTYYIYYYAPTGDGNSPKKAYAAGFVLLMIVLGLNALVTRLTLRGSGERAAVRGIFVRAWPWSGGRPWGGGR
ncbi:MAG TPA: ABC transporter permease subunit [Solirubrobacteraceae bacterium]|jgi:phosphate transport system permease protein|nr:ABC transporter permease subunit [Solirubrobacteraceae bacterium]